MSILLLTLSGMCFGMFAWRLEDYLEQRGYGYVSWLTLPMTLIVTTLMIFLLRDW